MSSDTATTTTHVAALRAPCGGRHNPVVASGAPDGADLLAPAAVLLEVQGLVGHQNTHPFGIQCDAKHTRRPPSKQEER